MKHLINLSDLIAVAPESTISRTVLKEEGSRVVLFALDSGQELTEHTAAVPILLSLLDGRVLVGANGQQVELSPGGLIHIGARVPHEVLALQPSRMVLTMLDPRRSATTPGIIDDSQGETRGIGSPLDPSIQGAHMIEALDTLPLADPHDRCTCGEAQASDAPILDARRIPPPLRHAAIFGALDSLPSGGAMILVAPHDPKPLLAQASDRYPTGITVEYLQRDPEEWHIRLQRA